MRAAAQTDEGADYTLLEKLGEGAFGKVFKAQQQSAGRQVAIKVVPVAQDTGEVAREIEMLKECQSDNIVRYYGSFQRGPELWIVMEYCAGSSLCDIMEATRRCLTEQQIGAVMAGTIEGLLYLHRLNKIHRDVKAGNLLLSETGAIKLADFGVSAQLGSTISRRGTVIGTPFWMAPEVISGGPEAGYDAKADVWSLGITAIELAVGCPPHADMHPMRAIFLIPTLPPPTLENADGSWSERITGFVARCLVKDVEQRPFTSELLSHPLVAEGRASQQAGVLLALMDASREPLRTWREQTSKAEDDAGRAAIGSGAFSDTTLKRGGTQEFDVEAIRGVAKAIQGEGGAGSSAAFGTMVVHDSGGDGAPGGGNAYGTMVVNDGPAVAPGCCGGGGSMIVNPGACGGGGSMIINPGAAAGAGAGGGDASAVPAFMRQFQPTSSAAGAAAGASSSAPSPCSDGSSCRSEASTAAPAAPPSERGSSARSRRETNDHAGGEKDRNKYDFSHLSLPEIDHELANIGANLERDMGKLKRQYEKRERALRAARVTKSGGGAAAAASPQ